MISEIKEISFQLNIAKLPWSVAYDANQGYLKLDLWLVKLRPHPKKETSSSGIETSC